MVSEFQAGFSTRAVHAGQHPDPSTGAVVPPVHHSCTFAQPKVGMHHGWDYGRTGNPTRDALETVLASLEGARHGFAFASGMAACDAVFRTCGPGDHVVMAKDVFGGIRRQAAVHQRWGLTFDLLDLTDIDLVAAAWPPATRMLWIETPTNPLMGVADIEVLSTLARARGAVVVVDNTLATPYLQQPLALGADIVVHSTTKYLGGHSDVIGGAVVTSDDHIAEHLGLLQSAAGAVPGPWDVFLVMRGIETLPIRMRTHCENARATAELLRSHGAVQQVLYPGLGGDRGHQIAARQMRDFGGMVSFRLADGDEAVRVCQRFRLFTLASSLGGVHSLVEHPRRMAASLEVPDDLVRLSVGIEDCDDLLADIEHALG